MARLIYPAVMSLDGYIGRATSRSDREHSAHFPDMIDRMTRDGQEARHIARPGS